MCNQRGAGEISEVNMPSIGAIIVNYRTGPLVVESLAALANERQRLQGLLHVYVVDNNSEDGSVELLNSEIIRRGWEAWVRLLPQSVNLGFAGGNNVALKHMLNQRDDYSFIYFVNPDAYIQPGAIEEARDFLVERPGIGILGSAIIRPDGSRRTSAFRFPTFVGEFLRGARTSILTRILACWDIAPAPQDVPHKTDWVTGAAFMVRREVIEQIGLMDEGYFLYYEELDYMRRATDKGWEIWHNPKSVVLHLSGQATQISQRDEIPDYWYRSWRRYFVKNHGRLYAALAGCSWLLGNIILRCKLFTQGHESRTRAAAFWRFFRLALIPSITRGMER